MGTLVLVNPELEVCRSCLALGRFFDTQLMLEADRECREILIL